MDRIFEAIEEWMRNLLTGMVSSNLTTMYTDVNEKTGQIAAQVGQTPQGWNGNIFSMIQNLSDSVIVPIAGMIITFVLCYDDMVWNEPYAGDYNIVMSHISHIREKIEDDPAHPVYIQTVWGVGYKFNGRAGSE